MGGPVPGATGREYFFAFVLAVATVFCLPILAVLLMWPCQWMVEIFLWALKTMGPKP